MRGIRVLLALLGTWLAVAAPAVAGSGEAPADNAAAREYFTDLPLLTQTGEQVRFYSDVLADRVVLISGFYTNCTSVSPRQNLILSRLQAALGDRLGREVVMVSITIDPTRDDVETVAEYAEVFHPADGWIFLTGKPENVDWVNYKLGQYLENLEDHKGTYLLGNLETGLWKKAPGHAQTDDLYREIQRLLEDDGEPHGG
jgi:protein SCO1/2